MSNLTRINRIIRKLQTVRQKETDQIVLNPPVSLAELEEFERKEGISLPEDYRDFLLYIGNGGAGPFWGINRLKDWNDYYIPFETDEIPADFLTSLSPLKPGYNNFSADVPRENLFCGTIVIGEQGCGVMTLLIVSGVYRGRVVYGEGWAGSPYVSREKDFLAWYERWLDEKIGGSVTNIFGLGPGGGAADFFRIIDSSPDQGEVLEAFGAFARLPELTPETVTRLYRYLDSGSDDVRATILWVIQKRNLPFNDELIAGCLADISAAIRKMGITLAVQRNYNKFRQQLFELALHDPDKEVAENACLKLLYPEENISVKRPLVREEAIQLLQYSPYPAIRSWVAYLNVYTKEDIDLLLSFLMDDMVITRANVITNLHRLKARKVVPEILCLLERERKKRPEEKHTDDQYVISRALYLLSGLGDISCVPELLLWAVHPADDFYRIEAVGALAGIGDKRGLPLAKRMLKEFHPPKGEGGSTSASSISKLVRDKLLKSPHPAFRKLAKPWWTLS